MKEIRIRHDDAELSDPQRITDLNKRLMAREFDDSLEDIHKHEIEDIIDDFDTGVRVMKIRKRKYFFT